MRKLPAVIAVLGLAAVALVGCSSTDTTASCPRPTPSASSAIDLVSVTGPTDAVPNVSVHTPFHTTDTQWKDVSAGTGTPITGGNQLVVLDVALFDGETGKALVATPYNGDESTVYAQSRWTESFPGFRAALQCATQGSRVAIALAPGDVDKQTAASLGMTDGASAVAVVDVRKVYLTRADGKNQYNQSFGLPTVVRAPNGRPGVIIPDSRPPKDLVVQVIKKGDGAKVTGDKPVRLHYTGVTWADKSVFDTTWDGDPQSITLSSMPKGFQKALKGQTVGSQVLVVVPPSQGFGDSQQGAVKENSTLVYVVDILGIDQAAATQ